MISLMLKRNRHVLCHNKGKWPKGNTLRSVVETIGSIAAAYMEAVL